MTKTSPDGSLDGRRRSELLLRVLAGCEDPFIEAQNHRHRLCAPPGTRSQHTSSSKHTEAQHVDSGSHGGAVVRPLCQHASL